MLMEVMELLQNSGGEEDKFVTDFSIYKLVSILTVYIPFIMATFLLSQEYLGMPSVNQRFIFLLVCNQVILECVARVYC